MNMKQKTILLQIRRSNWRLITKKNSYKMRPYSGKWLSAHKSV